MKDQWIIIVALSIFFLVPHASGQEIDTLPAVDSIELLADTLVLADSLEPAADNDFGTSEILRMFESLGTSPFFEEQYLVIDTNELNIYGYDHGEIPMYDDSVYRRRIEILASQTTIPLVFNATVKTLIERYTVRMRALTGRLLGLAYVYFPMFEETLDKYNMPLELKYLAMVESALNPLARSKAGAKGLWQFMHATGKQFGLKSNTLVEERFDPQKSTEAACRYMLQLYHRYKDWFLVLAAYNSGPGTVNKAIVRAGGAMDYWSIWPYLPRETRNYVPTFIAVNYVVSYASEHNLYPVDPKMLISGTDTVTIHDVLTFAQLHETIGVSYTDLESYNPQYLKGIIPANDSTPYVLRMPSQYILQFVEREREIYAYQTQEAIDRERILAEARAVSVETVHVVKKGETLASIAKKYGVSVANLKKWNNLKSDQIRIGQRLKLQGTLSSSSATASSSSSTPRYHTVKSGETLGSIARKYGVSVANLKKWNNLKSDQIRVNQRLRVSA